MFTYRKLAIKNICHQKFQVRIMFLLLLITSIGIFAGSLLIYSMKQGLKITKDRIGADIIVVPDKFVTNVEDALFEGKPCTVNFDSSWKSKLDNIEGVDKTSTQLYLASIGTMECCESTVQMIAVDMKTDFSIAPWLISNNVKTLKNNEIIIGCNIKKDIGDNVEYFGKTFTVASVLEETGMGYDNCMFVTYDIAYEIASESKYNNQLPFTSNEDVISMVLIKVEDDYEISTVSEKIKKKYQDDEITVYTTTSLLGNYVEKFERFEIFGTLAAILIFIIVIIALFALLTLSVDQRHKEIGCLLAVGITRDKISLIFIWEYTIIIIIATLIGIATTCFFILPFQNAIRQILKVPYYTASFKVLLQIGLQTILINILTCTLAATYSFYRIRKVNPAKMLKE